MGVRISFQTSGGRGEYELAERSNGVDAAQAVGSDLVLRIGGATLDTQIQVTHQQGKYRLRRHGADIQIARQVAAALLMPQPVRDQAALPPGAARLATQSYIMQDMVLDRAQLEGGRLKARIASIAFGGTGPVDATRRFEEVERLWGGRDAFPGAIPILLAQHELAVRAGSVRSTAARLVAGLQQDAARQVAPLGIDYDEDEDLVPALLAALGGQPGEPAEPQPAAPLPPEPIDVRRREIKRARSWLRRRTAASARFSRDVREAYRHQCLICGKSYPTTAQTKSGVQAAHILPWAKYDVDVVPNGLSLCPTHHWMFDEGLFVIQHDPANDEYRVVVPAWVKGLASDGFSVDSVDSCAGPIPEKRLPSNPANRPSPDLLSRAADYSA